MFSAWAFIPGVAQHLKIPGVFIFSTPCQSFTEGTVHLTKSPSPLALCDHKQAHSRRDSCAVLAPSGRLPDIPLCFVLTETAWKTGCKEKPPSPVKFLMAGTDVV